jgi:hypothetical protein
LYSHSKTKAGANNFAWVIPVMLVCATCVTPAAPGHSRAWFEDPTYQAKTDVLNGERSDRSLKTLGTLIEGNIAEVGKRSAKYDLYRYEAFRFDGCFMGWRETHESYEAEARLSKEIQELTIPLSTLSQASVRVDKIGESAYVVSFTTLKLKTALVSHVRSTYQDLSEDEYDSLQSGGGIYFQSNEVARRVAKALVLGISSCQEGTS